MSREEFQGDLRVMSGRQFIDHHIRMLEDLTEVPIAQAFAKAIKLCNDAGKHDLAILTIMSLLMDLHRRGEDAVRLWIPLSKEIGLPVGVIGPWEAGK